MKKLQNRIDRFFFRNRDLGIPNLMLYIALGNAIVMIMSMMLQNNMLYNLLRFDKSSILQGQVWRLVTYVFTQSTGGFLELIFLYFFYMLGRSVEMRVGTLKFNLFYLSGVVLMDVFGMIFCPTAPVLIGNIYYLPEAFTNSIYSNMAYFLHLSLVLAFATSNPDAQFLILFIIPIKAWIIALIYLVLIGVQVFQLSYPLFLFPHNLFPLVGLANYFLFFAADLPNLLPPSWRLRKMHSRKSKGPKVIQFEQAGPYRSAPQKADFIHKCTICGRTDTTNPELEFRYCSRCNGYHCYCSDHINNHTHVE